MKENFNWHAQGKKENNERLAKKAIQNLSRSVDTSYKDVLDGSVKKYLEKRFPMTNDDTIQQDYAQNITNHGDDFLKNTNTEKSSILLKKIKDDLTLRKNELDALADEIYSRQQKEDELDRRHRELANKIKQILLLIENSNQDSDSSPSRSMQFLQSFVLRNEVESIHTQMKNLIEETQIYKQKTDELLKKYEQLYIRTAHLIDIFSIDDPQHN